MDNLHIPITGDNKGFVNALNEARDKVRSTAKDIEQSGMSIEQMFNRIKLAAAGAFMGLSVKGLISDIIRVRGEFQRADTAIQTMLGSKEKADDLLSKVREYAKISPLEFGDITRATQMMLGFNIEADKVPGFIKAIGDVSMGESGKFNSLTLAFSQMSATGKLMGQDLNQMINAGFNPLSVMAEKTGKSVAELKEQMSKGAITAQMVQQAFIDATSEGGKFFNMSEEAAKTIGGKISMLNDAMDNMYNELGKKGEKIIMGSISAITKLVDNYEIIGKVLLELVSIYGSYKAALIVNIALEKTQAFNRLAHAKGMTAMQLATSILTTKTKALNAVLMKNPYVLLATAIMSAVSALVIFRKETDEAARKAEELQEELKNQDQELGENRACLQRLQTEWNKLTSDKEKKRWITENKDEFQKLGIEIDTVQEAENAFVNNSGAIIKAMELRAKAAAHAALATRRYQEALENREAGHDRRKNPTKADKFWGIVDVGWDFDFSGSIERQANIAANRLHASATKAEREAKEHLDEQKKLEQEASDLMKAAKIKTGESGKTDKKTGKTGKNANPAEDAAKERQRLFELSREEAREREKTEQETTDLLTKLSIADTKNSEEKKRKEEDFQHQLNLRQIDKEAKEMKEARLKQLEDAWNATNKDKTKVWADTEQAKLGISNISLTSGQQFYIDTKKAIEDKAYSSILEQRKKMDEEAMRSYLKEYGTYQEKRLAISQEYEEKIRDTKIEGERLALEKQRDEDIEALDEQYGIITQSMADLFADASTKSMKAIQDVIDKYEKLVEYLEGHKGTASKDELSTLGLSDRDIDRVLKGEISIKELTDRLKEMKGELAERSPYKSFEVNMKKAIELFQKAKNSADLGNAISYTASQVQAFLPAVKEFGQNISNIFGADDSKLTAAIDGLDGLMTAGQGVGQIMQGDIVGGAMSAVKGISQMVDALDGAFGADYSQYNKMVEQYDRLIDVWDELIDRKTEYLSMSYGMEADKAGKEAIELANKEIEAYKELGKARLNAGASAGSSSIGRRITKNMSGNDWQNIAEALGLSVNDTKNKLGSTRLTGLFDLTAEELKSIQENAYSFWATLDDDVQKYLQGIIDGEKQIKDLEKQTTQQILNTSVDNVFDDFMSHLYDLADDSEDVFEEVAENWEKMMNKMVLNNLVGAKYKSELEKWYQQWNEAYTGDGTLDKEEINALRNSYNELIHQAADEVNTLKTQGIITSPSSVYKQEGSSGGWQSMGQDTADELNGRFTALQIAGEKIAEGVTATLVTLSSLSSLADDRNITLVEIRNLMITNNAFLEDILTMSKKMYNDFGQKLDKININTK